MCFISCSWWRVPQSFEEWRATLTASSSAKTESIEPLLKIPPTSMRIFAEGPMEKKAIGHLGVPGPSKQTASNQEEKVSVIAQLRPLLSPRLRQDGLTWEETAPLLAKLHIDFLRKAVDTANVQSVIAKLKAAAYQKPAMRKLVSSENLQSLKTPCQKADRPLSNSSHHALRLRRRSPVKKLSSCPEALYELVVSDDDLISASIAQNNFHC